MRGAWTAFSRSVRFDSFLGRPLPDHSAGSAACKIKFRLVIGLVAVLTCSLSLVLDIAASSARRLRGVLAFTAMEAAGGLGASAPGVEAVALLAWVSSAMFLAGLAHLCARQRPLSFGSGLPELKCILQRTFVEGFLHPLVLPIKLGGLILAQSAGLPVGKEGPLAHVAAIIAQNLVQLPAFDAVRRIPLYGDKLMAASVSVGLCSAFGVPIGGVLFAMEWVPEARTNNMTYWVCLFAAIVGSLVLRSLPILFSVPIVNLLPPLPETVMVHINSAALEEEGFLWLLAIPLGAICGAAGALFVSSTVVVGAKFRQWIAGGGQASASFVIDTLTESLAETVDEPDSVESWRIAKKLPTPLAQGPRPGRRALLLCMVVAGLDALVSFVVPALRGASQGQFLWELVSQESMAWGSTEALGKVQVPSLPHDEYLDMPLESPRLRLLAELCCFAWKFVSTMLALSIPVPAGCVAPCYVMGALLGRSYMHFWQLFFPQRLSGYYAHFAIIGATAYSAAVCRSFSVVIAVSELVGVTKLMLPISIAALVAIAVGNMFSPSFFDAVAQSKSLPLLSNPRSVLAGGEPVSSVMRDDVPLVPEDLGKDVADGRRYIRDLLDRHPHQTDFPVVAGDLAAVLSAPLVGVASRHVVEALAEGFPADGSAGARLRREDLHVARQVPTSMSVREAELALELHADCDLFVVRHGAVIGVVGFEDLLHEQHAKLQKRT